MENISKRFRLSDILYVYVKNSFEVSFVRHPELAPDNIQEELCMSFEAFENLVSPTISEIIRKGFIKEDCWMYFDERNVPIKLFRNNFFECFMLNKNCEYHNIQKLSIDLVTNEEWMYGINFLKYEWKALIRKKERILSKIALARSKKVQEGIKNILL